MSKEETYSIGDRFVHNDEKYILVMVGQNETELVCLSDGMHWAGGVRVDHWQVITSAEFNDIRSGGKFTRYYDFQKKILYKERLK
ncbi:MAG: hypothetical protein KAS32_10600 [Candidatus Peribacteraceae bacterium]|nr:hypothetical protein [Candidatus Peribacteraceae bacterium]